MEPLTTLLALLAGAFGGYLTGYVRKKGENLATHEDIGKLTEQVAAVTKTAKEIEAKISSDVWDRQKRWELKREVLSEATRKASQLNDTLRTLHTTLHLVRNDPFPDDLDLLRRQREILTRWNKAVSEFAETTLWVGVVCGEEVTIAIHGLAVVATSIAVDVNKGEGNYEEEMEKFNGKLFVTLKAIRDELRIDVLDQAPS
jgi:hypothetical protein